MLLLVTFSPIIIVMLGILWRVARSHETHRPKAVTSFILPHQYFVSLILLANFWLILLLLLGLRELPEEQRSALLILVALFAPFLSWWRQNRPESP